MRIFNLITAVFLALTPAMLVVAQVDDTPELGVVTTFPNNPFSIVKNGQPNTVVFSITNPPKEDRLLTLQSITGAFLNIKKEDGQRARVVRNMTTTAFKSRPLRSVGGKAVQIAYNFVPEFKPQDMEVEFYLTVNDEQTGKKHNLRAYRGKVQVTEPAKDFFDLQLLSIYFFVIATIIGAGYWAYLTYLSPSTNQSVSAKNVEPSVVNVAKSTGYEQEWIPDLHLRSRKSNNNVLSSGDEEPVSPGRKQKGGRK